MRCARDGDACSHLPLGIGLLPLFFGFFPGSFSYAFASPPSSFISWTTEAPSLLRVLGPAPLPSGADRLGCCLPEPCE